ncbi:MAG: glycosyltransferase family 39 protein [Candidatus Pacebacteria bacterium]|nr:glycosyltransferase family 39 protein [Candidatus Paceibacterota bacterium]
MSYILSEIFWPLALAIIFLDVSYLIGWFFIKRLHLEIGEILEFVLSVLLGWGLIGYLIVFFSLIKIISIWLFGAFFIIVLISGWRASWLIFKNLKKSAIDFWKEDWLIKALLLLVLMMMAFYLLTALSPPFQCDELAYHMPEAIRIMENGVLSLGGTTDVCGNYPLLMEATYGLLYSLGGFSLVHLIHYQILLVALLAVYCFVKKKFDAKAALLSLALILTLYEFLMNATSAYVDAAQASFEIAAIFLFFRWLEEKKNRNLLILAGVFLGFALSIKFTAFYTLLPLILFFIWDKVKNKVSFRSWALDSLSVFAPLFFAAIFWYVKTWVMAGHPLYPFFGSNIGNEIVPTMMPSSGSLGSLMLGRLKNILTVPFQFTEPYYLLILVAYLSLPFVWFIKAERIWLRRLLVFSLLYFSIWAVTVTFFTKRYISAGLVVLLVLLAISLTKFWEKLAPRRIFRIIVILALTSAIISGVILIITHKNNHFLEVKQAEIGYLLGVYDKQDFYTFRGNLAGIYAIASYFNDNYQGVKIVMNWGRWDIFLEGKNRFVSVHPDYPDLVQFTSWEDLCASLRKKNLTFLAVDGHNKKRDHEMARGESLLNLEKTDRVEQLIADHSDLIMDDYNAQIYKINLFCK